MDPPPIPPKVVGKSPDCQTFQKFWRGEGGALVDTLLGNCPELYMVKSPHVCSLFIIF